MFSRGRWAQAGERVGRPDQRENSAAARPGRSRTSPVVVPRSACFGAFRGGRGATGTQAQALLISGFWVRVPEGAPTKRPPLDFRWGAFCFRCDARSTATPHLARAF